MEKRTLQKLGLLCVSVVMCSAASWWSSNEDADRQVQKMAEQLVAVRRPDHLIIEGGATAWATLQTLGWTQFQIECQIAPGVVQMRAPSGTLVTLKPGSYSWGGLMG